MKHNKFNVGDKVRILDGSKIENYAGCWVYSIKEYVGKMTEITGIKMYSDGQIGYYLRGCDGFCFDERGLELASGETKAGILIRREGNKVIARDEETGKTGVAKCSPDDAFDFMTGADLALKRLREQFPKHKFKVGDRVIGNVKASFQYSHTRFGWIGEVVELEDDGEFTLRGPGITQRYSLFSSLREECFDLYDGFLPGDKVKVTLSYVPVPTFLKADLIEKVTALTKDNNYLIRFAFETNRTGIIAHKHLGTELTVVAANKDYALVTAGDDAPVYIISTRDLTRC